MTSFFNVLSIDQTISLLQNISFSFSETQVLPLDNVENHILAQDILASEDLPFTSRSAMDGYALIAEDTFGASENNPAFLSQVMSLNINEVPQQKLEQGQCAKIVTGGIPPENANAVIMIEHTESLGNNTIEIRKTMAPFSHLMLQGEDVKKHSIALLQNTFLRSQEIGLLAALGVHNVLVYSPFQVGILSTGDEIIPIDQNPKTGQIRDVNSYTLSALIKKVHAIPHRLGIIPDTPKDLQNALAKATQQNFQIILLSGGSSIGTRDFTLQVLQSLNAEILCHGIAMSPGKPLILAKLNNKLVCGLPGQVTSAQVVMLRLILPLIQYNQGNKNAFDLNFWPNLNATLTRNIPSAQGREDYIRVKISKENNIFYASPILGHSGLIKTLLHAQGLIQIPANQEGLEENSSTKVYLL